MLMSIALWVLIGLYVFLNYKALKNYKESKRLLDLSGQSYNESIKAKQEAIEWLKKTKKIPVNQPHVFMDGNRILIISPDKADIEIVGYFKE